MNCLYCKEPFIEGEPVTTLADDGSTLHPECVTRMIVGSVGHQQKKCQCFGGTEDDPEGATRRQGALAATALYRGRMDA